MRQDNVFFGELTRKEFNDAVAADMIEAAIVPTGALTVRAEIHLETVHEAVIDGVAGQMQGLLEG